MKSCKKKYDRRKFLSHTTSYLALGLGASPLEGLFSSIIGGMSNRAWAAANGLNPRNYLFIQQAGAPSRWMFDLMLTPYSTSGFVENPMVATRLGDLGGRYIERVYQTVNIAGINVPWMWRFPVPSAGGGSRPLSDLLQNMLVIQGATTNNAGHGQSQQFQFLTPGSRQSNLALSADASTAPFAALNNNAAQFLFLSKKNKIPQSVNSGGNILNSLLSVFNQTGSLAYRQRKEAIKAALDVAASQLNTLAIDGHPGAEAVVNNRKSAMELMDRGFSGLDAVWSQLLTKYSNLITRSFASVGLEGVNDLPVGSEGLRNNRYNLQNGVISAPDLRALVSSQTNIPRLAEGFALAEYCLTEGLSTAITISPGAISGLSLNGNSSSVMTNDQHQVGVFPNTLLSIFSYMAYGACLLELVDRLKESNQFSDTVIELSGEFNRSPRTDQTGSDHGWQGRSSTFISGAYNGPLCVGNFARISTGPYAGVWGAGGAVSQLGRQLGLPDILATLAYLIRVPSPITSATTLVSISGQIITPLVEKTVIV